MWHPLGRLVQREQCKKCLSLSSWDNLTDLGTALKRASTEGSIANYGPGLPAAVVEA